MSDAESLDGGVIEAPSSSFGVLFRAMDWMHRSSSEVSLMTLTSIRSRELGDLLTPTTRRGSVSSVLECVMHLGDNAPVEDDSLTYSVEPAVDPIDPRRQAAKAANAAQVARREEEWRRVQAQGEVFEALQAARLYDDSKSVVDLVAVADPEEVAEAFKKLQLTEDDLRELELGNPELRRTISDFKSTWFVESGQEFEVWHPPDWRPHIRLMSRVSDPRLRGFVAAIHELWQHLGRRLSDEVLKYPHRYTHIPLKLPFIVPGGRFTEVYYWDSYWIVLGLVRSEMYDTAKGIVRNFCQMVHMLGYIPNGSRSYYVSRSQPPYLTQMIHLVSKASNDWGFIRECLPWADIEYNFWMRNRSRCLRLKNAVHVVNIYNADLDAPREESFREDRELLRQFNISGADAKTLMRNIRAACETGWDFSSRWMGPALRRNGSVNDDVGGLLNVLPYLKTIQVVPVDLNSLMALNERTLRNFHHMVGKESLALSYMEAYTRRCAAMEALMWNESSGCYFDCFVSSAGHISHNKQFFPSNVHPLISQCFPPNKNARSRNKTMFEYLKHQGVLDYLGGIPTSLNKTEQQWDFANVWPPLVHNIVIGLEASCDPELLAEGRKQAAKWIRTSYLVHKRTRAIFEKMSTEAVAAGAGGEYSVQAGFGWSNGVILDLLSHYPMVTLDAED